MTDSGGVNASASFQLTVNAAKLAITTASPLLSAKVNGSYTQTVMASGGVPPYTWGSNITAPGFTFSAAGVLSGTPSTTGTYSFTIQVTDSAAGTASSLFQLTVGFSFLGNHQLIAARGAGRIYLRTGSIGKRRHATLPMDGE